jgi:hypothetical protein
MSLKPYPNATDPRALEQITRLRREDSSIIANLMQRLATLEAGGGGGGGGGATTLNDLTDVVISSPASGQVLLYDGSQWENDYYTSYFP